MPLYEYRCDACQLLFEELVSGSAPQVSCPRCQSKSVARQMSVFAAHGGHAEPACAGACADGGCPVASGPRPGGGCCGGACSH